MFGVELSLYKYVPLLHSHIIYIYIYTHTLLKFSGKSLIKNCMSLLLRNSVSIFKKNIFLEYINSYISYILRFKMNNIC
jgi:hypothetical protein